MTPKFVMFSVEHIFPVPVEESIRGYGSTVREEFVNIGNISKYYKYKDGVEMIIGNHYFFIKEPIEDVTDKILKALE